MMGDFKLSVIIPVYNREKYLKCCLDSVLAQTLQEIEVIIVNDGSTDRSLEIARSFENEYSMFTVVSQEKSGQSAARNAGIDLARGDYITFLDSDDFIDPIMYEQLYNTAIENESEIVKCGAVVFNDNSGQVIGNRNDFTSFTEITSNKEILENYLDRKLDKVVWNGIYDIRLFEKIRFPEIRSFVDQYVSPHLFVKTNKYTYLPKNLYYYRKHSNSLSHSRTSRELVDLIKSLNELYKIICEHGLLEELSHVYSTYFYNLIYDYHNQVIYSDPFLLKRNNLSIRNLINPEALEYAVNSDTLNKRQVTFLRLMSNSHYLFFLYQKFVRVSDLILVRGSESNSNVEQDNNRVQATSRNKELIKKFALPETQSEVIT